MLVAHTGPMTKTHYQIHYLCNLGLCSIKKKSGKEKNGEILILDVTWTEVIKKSGQKCNSEMA